MDPINQIGIDTRFGYRTFELYEGDLTRIGCQVDILVASAFKGNYEATKGTVVGALQRSLGLDVAHLASTCDFDFRDALGIWISKPIEGREFTRLLCVEM